MNLSATDKRETQGGFVVAATAPFLRRLITGSLLVSLFVVTLAGLWLTHSRNQDIEDARTSTKNLSKILEQYVAGTVRQVDLALLSAQDEVRRQISGGGIDAKALNAFLAQQQDHQPEILSLRIADAEGVARYGRGVPIAGGPKNSDREYFIRARDESPPGLIVTKPVFTRLDKKWAIVLARRLNRPDGSFAGVVYINLALEHLTNVFSGIDVGRHGVVSLRDAEMALVARHPELKGIGIDVGSKLVSRELQGLLKAGKTEGTYYTPTGATNIARTVSFRRIGDHPLYIIVGLAHDDIHAEWRAEVAGVLSLVALFLLLMLYSSRSLFIAWKKQTESEWQLKTIVEAEPECVKVLAPDGTLRQMNRAGLDMIEADSEAQVIGGKVTDLVVPEHRQAFIDLGKRIGQGESGTLEFEVIGLKGGHRWLETHAVPMRNAENRIVGLLGVTRDITTSRAIEAALRESEQMLREAQEVGRIGSYAFDIRADRWTSSKVLDDLLGIDADYERSMAGWERLVHPTEREDMATYFQTVAAQGIRFNREYRIVRRNDGAERWVHVTGEFSRDAQGMPLRLVGTVQDITQRKRDEQRIARSEQRMELALAGADLGLWDLDIPSGSFTHNPRLVTMLGYTLGEVEVNAKTLVPLLHPDDAPRFGAAFYAHLKGETASFEAEYRVRRKDDHWIWILSRGMVVERDENGRAVRMTGTNLDISERKYSEAALKAREARLSTLIASMQDLVFVLDTAGTVVEYFHPPLSHRPAYRPRNHVLGKTYTEILPADIAGQFDEAIAGIVMDGQSRTFEYPLTINGNEFISLATLSPLAGETKYPTGFLAVVRDITTERASQREIEHLARTNTLLLESVGEGIYGVDSAHNTTFVNSAAQAMLGFTEAELLGQEQHTLFHHHRPDGASYPANQCPIGLTLEDGLLRREENEWFWRKDGSGFPVAMTVTPMVENGSQVGAVVVFQDITERKVSEAKIHDLAFYDPLTRLPNRRLLLDRLKHTMSASQRSGCFGALMFLDLDNFKPLNDTHGHVVGDLLLIEAANRLKSCVRDVDTVARFGGDEFVVMLNELSADRTASASQAKIVAGKIRSTLSEPYLLTVKREGNVDTTVEHHCTASIGVALFIDHEASQDDILMWADSAMYRAKESGRNLVQFASEMP